MVQQLSINAAIVAIFAFLSAAIASKDPKQLEFQTEDGGELQCMCRYKSPDAELNAGKVSKCNDEYGGYFSGDGEASKQPWMPAPRTNQWNVDHEGRAMPMFSETRCYESCQEHKCGEKFQKGGWDAWYECLHVCFKTCYHISPATYDRTQHPVVSNRSSSSPAHVPPPSNKIGTGDTNERTLKSNTTASPSPGNNSPSTLRSNPDELLEKLLKNSDIPATTQPKQGGSAIAIHIDQDGVHATGPGNIDLPVVVSSGKEHLSEIAQSIGNPAGTQ